MYTTFDIDVDNIILILGDNRLEKLKMKYISCTLTSNVELHNTNNFTVDVNLSTEQNNKLYCRLL